MSPTTVRILLICFAITSFVLRNFVLPRRPRHGLTPLMMMDNLADLPGELKTSRAIVAMEKPDLPEQEQSAENLFFETP